MWYFRTYSRRLTRQAKRESVLQPILSCSSSPGNEDNGEEEEERQRVLDEMKKLQDKYKVEGA